MCVLVVTVLLKRVKYAFEPIASKIDVLPPNCLSVLYCKCYIFITSSSNRTFYRMRSLVFTVCRFQVRNVYSLNYSVKLFYLTVTKQRCVCAVYQIILNSVLKVAHNSVERYRRLHIFKTITFRRNYLEGFIVFCSAPEVLFH
jgi:hypothetical protein